MKILAYDVENLPMITNTWGLFGQNISHKNIIEHASIISVAWGFVGETKINLTSIADCKSRLERNIYDDYHPVAQFHKVLNSNEEFVLLAHNGDQFDTKKLNTAFLRHNLPPVNPRQSIDTLKEARRLFRIDSNRLDYIARFLGVGEKMDTGGQDLWNNILQWKYQEYGTKPDKALALKALKHMGEYNKHDIVILKGVFEKMRNRIKIPNALLYTSEAGSLRCPDCLGAKFIGHGFRYTGISKIPRYRCQSCKRIFTQRTASYRTDFRIG